MEPSPRGLSWAGITAQHDMKEAVMLYWALLFFVVAVIAGLFGFGGVASASAGIAQILFFVFLILFVVSLFRRAV